MRRRKRRYPLGLSLRKMHSKGNLVRALVISFFAVIVIVAVALIVKPFGLSKLFEKTASTNNTPTETPIIVPTPINTDNISITPAPTQTPEQISENNTDNGTEGNEQTNPLMTDMSSIMYKSSGERVIILQTRLIELSYLHIEKPTEFYGHATQLAVSEFQKQHGYKVTGNANSKTLKLMFSDSAQKYTLKINCKGDGVKALQEILVELNYLDTKATGFYGVKTVDAIKSFQTANGFEATGIADSVTIDKLYSLSNN